MNEFPDAWDIYLAWVKYSDVEGGKERPVVIVDDKIAYLICFPITSHDPREGFKGEVPIKKWKEAGLDKPSTIRISGKINLRSTDLLHKIGRLRMTDINAVQMEIDKEFIL